MLYESHTDLASWTRTSAVINELLNMINFDFDFTKVVDAILSNIEKYTNCRGIAVSEVDFTLSKKIIARSPQFKDEYENATPIFSLPVTLINNRVSHTLDIYNLEANALPRKDSDTLLMFRDLLQEAVNKEATKRDALTGLYSRGYFDSQLEMEVINSKSSNKKFSLLMIDIDHFKKINDTYGHPVGDLVLEKISMVLKALTDKKGTVSRYGGEELTVILPGYTEDDAFKMAEEIRSYISSLKITLEKGENLKVTVSMGIAVFPKDGSDAFKLLKASDRALYSAKESGRDRVISFSEIRETKEEYKEHKEEKVRIEEKAVQTQPKYRTIRTDVKPLLLSDKLSGQSHIRDVYITPDGNIYLLDSLQSKVAIFNKTGELLNVFGKKGEGVSDAMMEPTSINVDREGWIWITDSGNHAIKAFDNLGGSIITISATIDEEGKPLPGMGKGCFNLPYALLITEKDEVVVVERINRRIQRFDRMGKFIREMNIPQEVGSDLLHRPDPIDICPDGEGGYLILDAINSNIIHFSENDEVISFFGTFGIQEGMFSGISAIAYYPKWERITGDDGKPVIVSSEMGDVNRIQFFTSDGDFIKSIDLSPFSQEQATIRPTNIFCNQNGEIFLVPHFGRIILYIIRIQ
jgi:diguanylate cyclase (GGDEF)-like protein